MMDPFSRRCTRKEVAIRGPVRETGCRRCVGGARILEGVPAARCMEGGSFAVTYIGWERERALIDRGSYRSKMCLDKTKYPSLASLEMRRACLEFIMEGV